MEQNSTQKPGSSFGNFNAIALELARLNDTWINTGISSHGLSRTKRIQIAELSDEGGRRHNPDAGMESSRSMI